MDVYPFGGRALDRDCRRADRPGKVCGATVIADDKLCRLNRRSDVVPALTHYGVERHKERVIALLGYELHAKPRSFKKESQLHEICFRPSAHRRIRKRKDKNISAIRTSHLAIHRGHIQARAFGWMGNAKVEGDPFQVS